MAAAALKNEALDAAKEVAPKLDLAGLKAEQAAAKMQADGKSGAENGARKMTGTAMRESQQKVANSRKQLGDGASPQAQATMQQAAKALQNAAQAALRQMEASASSQGSPQSLRSDQAGAAWRRSTHVSALLQGSGEIRWQELGPTARGIVHAPYPGPARSLWRGLCSHHPALFPATRGRAHKRAVTLFRMRQYEAS